MAKTIGKISLGVLIALSVIFIALNIYAQVFMKDVTYGINYIEDQNGVDIVESDKLTEEEKNEYEERWFLEASYYSNDKNNGIELQDFRINYFMDWRLTSDVYRSVGMQYIGELDLEDKKVHSEAEAGYFIFPGFTYYNTSDDITWDATNNVMSTPLSRDTRFIIKIDSRAFEIQLTGSYDTGVWPFITHHYYSWATVFSSVKKAIESNSAGYGDYYVHLDLSKLFTIKEYDYETKKFKPDDVTDIIKTYSVLKFHYDENGAKKAEQSIFGQIEGNTSYGSTGEIDADYWQSYGVYNLTEKQISSGLLSLRKNETGESYLSVSVKLKELFEKMPNAKVNIKIDLDADLWKDSNFIGFDYKGFEGFKLNKITLLGTSEHTVTFLTDSLKNTDLKTIEHASSITLSVLPDAINSEYSEVVL